MTCSRKYRIMSDCGFPLAMHMKSWRACSNGFCGRCRSVCSESFMPSPKRASMTIRTLLCGYTWPTVGGRGAGICHPESIASARSDIELQQPRRVAAQDQVTVLRRQLAQLLHGPDHVGNAHVGGEVGAGHDPVGADLPHQVHQDRHAVGHGVVMEAAQIM